MIEARDLTKIYGNRTVVNKVSFSVGAGEIFGLLGPRDAGKTTTMRMLLGLVRPTSGTGTVAGFDIAGSVAELRKACGVLHDPCVFYDNMTARQNLRFYGSLYGLEGKYLDRKVEETLARVGLKDEMDWKVGQFGKGMKQRFGVAQVILHDPPVMMFDEPVTGISPQDAEDYRKLMLEMKAKGKTVFLTSQTVPEVEAICDRIGIIAKGEMYVCGNADQLTDQFSRRHGYLLRLQVREIDEPRVKSSLAGIGGISSVTKDGELYLISAAQDVSEDVSLMIRKAGGRIAGLEACRPTLSEIFLEIASPAGVKKRDSQL